MNDLDLHALIEIESQLRRNAFDWHWRHAQKIVKRQLLHPPAGDLVLNLDTILGHLRAKARGPQVKRHCRTDFW